MTLVGSDPSVTVYVSTFSACVWASANKKRETQKLEVCYVIYVCCVTHQGRKKHQTFFAINF